MRLGNVEVCDECGAGVTPHTPACSLGLEAAIGLRDALALARINAIARSRMRPFASTHPVDVDLGYNGDE